jgi:hypothetical protein
MSGLPDGIFSYQNPIKGVFLKGLEMDNFGIHMHYGQLEHIMAIWNIL